MNAPAYFEIQADDTKRAVEFYREIFGWKFQKADGLPVEYWTIETEGPRGGLLKRPAKTPPPEHGNNAFVCSMEVINFDQTAAKNRSLRRYSVIAQVCCARSVLAGIFRRSGRKHVRDLPARRWGQVERALPL